MSIEDEVMSAVRDLLRDKLSVRVVCKRDGDGDTEVEVELLLSGERFSYDSDYVFASGGAA